MQSDCIILGGGASGLTACAALAESGLRVTLVERLDRVGKKIMAAGNGRCNLSNENMDASFYGKAAPFVRQVYSVTPPEEVHDFFANLGLMTVSEEGRIYPRTMMASSVLDVLRAGCERENVTLLTGQEAVSLTPSRRGGWSVQLSGGEGVFAPVIICAMGGSASPHLGTDGAGVRLLETLGHSSSKQYPSLVQLKCEHGALRSLKGIRLQAALSLEINEEIAALETGELLFADYGVSGVCVFQLSGLAAQALGEKKTVRLLVNLLPEIDDVSVWLHARMAAHPQLNALALFTGVFPRLMTMAVLKQAGISPDAPLLRLSDKQIHSLKAAIVSFPLPVTGTQGFKNAQVTRGGIDLDEADPQTMASRLFDGLYILGETLNVDGPCGGYNLHFAFAGALTAAKAIIKQSRKDFP